MIRFLFAALALSFISAPALAQDSLDTSTAPPAVETRLPLVRAVTDGDRVVLQIVGSKMAEPGQNKDFYIGPNGLTTNIAEAQNVRGAPGSNATADPVPGPKGDPGDSAYQIWLANGNDGTKAAFLASLQGAQGIAGGVGPAGANGIDGASAYQLWLAAGNTGTVADFLASLHGATGAQGVPGADARELQIRVNGGLVQTGYGGAWSNLVSLADLTGPQGPKGDTGPKGDKGDTGDQGASIVGPAGPKGDAGAAATVQVGKLSILGAGSEPTISNVGTPGAAVLNFGLPRSAVYLSDITLTQTAAVQIAAGPRTLTVSDNCQMGDRLFMSPSSALPAGFMLGGVYCSDAGTVQATIYAPLLAIGASYSITVRVTAFR